MPTKQVYKYGPLRVCFGSDPHALSVKVQGKPTLVGIQGREAFIWCEDIGGPTYDVVLYPTGAPYQGRCVGSLIDEAGFVFHAVVLE